MLSQPDSSTYLQEGEDPQYSETKENSPPSYSPTLKHQSSVPNSCSLSTVLSRVHLQISSASAKFRVEEHKERYRVKSTEMVIAKNDEFETLSSEELEVEDEEEEIVTQVKGRHVESGHKTLLRSSPLYQYILETSVYPREAEVLKELRELTEQHSWNMMATPPDEGQFLMLLLRLMNAKKTLEVGVYTGYSLLCTALALPPDGKVIALDISREWYDIGAPVIQKAGVAHKIDFREGPAMDNIDDLLRDEKNHGSFDFIFVDADKDNYLNYHKRLMKLVRVGGVIGYDNTLWNGALVAGPDDPLPKYLRYYKSYILELNSFLAKDSRIQISQVPISDGVTLCRRLF